MICGDMNFLCDQTCSIAYVFLIYKIIVLTQVTFSISQTVKREYIVKNNRKFDNDLH